MSTIPKEELATLCERALLAVGAPAEDAKVLSDATVEAELVGNRAVGVGHLFDYLDGYRQGRISGVAQPKVRRAAAAVIDVDAGKGLAQTAFQAAFRDLLEATNEAGIAALWVRDSYTCGELGYYARKVAQQGYIAVATANSPALMSIGGAPKRILGTNPLAYGIPRPGGMPMVIDQASSSTAFVNIRRAADAGDPIPAGWALNADGEPTVDANEALAGTLLPFGGHRGGNIALLVEILATLSGASFSLDAAPFDSGSTSPGIGVFVLCIDPANFTGSADRLATQLENLRDQHQVRLPAMALTELPEHVEIDARTLQRLQQAANSQTSTGEGLPIQRA
ncbi:Ldh family oxidoreductase [Arthrobacter sp. FW305-BF8]|uniref:Ldh family oxidoreductase n=1 Tax=Arthrobacter sp. FW305-BF8 TaxID=2879617 RepID=UPI001F392C76|nr:Ldh family oxidoreductase [Arthrobacter sp. FW305-BF8]UKA56358.1 Ldh family oxidoreductase [Arthrobacter sp. FW305-BF8]